ncbi:putative flavin-containing monooxygenase 1 [Nymphaea thermarum]|nr:putative flavin-containing monooxygenase 1 [Nymphaea thermarum]
MANLHDSGTGTPEISKVGIIGAGVSGIAAAKQLRHFSPIVFEATDSVGGVWKHCAFHCTRLQTPRNDYEFSDYPWPPLPDYPPPENDSATFPTHLEIVEYLENYARHFDVLKFVKLNHRVVEIKYLSDRKPTYYDGMWGNFGKPLSGEPAWEVGVQTPLSEDIQWFRFEFLVVCLGKYGDVAKMPEFPTGKGPEIFQGTVLHSLDYSKLDRQEAERLVKGKKVVVVGYKKSAIDFATECAEVNQGPDRQPCTMLIRTLHWIMLPSYSVWGISFLLLYATRFSQFLHERPSMSLLRALLCLLLSPLRKAISKFIELYLIWKLPLRKFGLVPEHAYEEDYASCQMAILPEKFFPAAEDGRICFRRSSKWCFWSGGVELEDGSRLEADVVMLATGFDGLKKLKWIFPEPFRHYIQDSSGIVPLYRGTVHPLIPHMAFVGYIESVSNLHTSEIRCRWLSSLLQGAFVLPTVDKMVYEISKQMEVMKRTTRFYKRHCISTFSINHTDEMYEDMGLSPWRKRNWLQEAFSPYSNRDYKDDN